uniref:HAT C-terminal dimerisation domain-containing protein n=1 Tax=Lactuca sativa TaxID=4236 RepID=A0A9R1WW71_LACSA|nr:hypothetical protein LSAT_V11C800413040 [Lactuca sativa]
MEKSYKPIIDIISNKMKGTLDSKLHLTAWLLNPYYHYKDSQLQHDPEIMDVMQRQVVTIDLPKYKEKVDRFGVELAYRSCMVNDADFDSAIWWGIFGGSTPHLTKIAMRILSLTSSLSGCERNWNMFEVHSSNHINMRIVLRCYLDCYVAITIPNLLVLTLESLESQLSLL